MHYVLWKRGAPRFDTRVEALEAHANMLRKEGILNSGKQAHPIADIMHFYGQHITEWNLNKDADGNDLQSFVERDVNNADEHTAAITEEEMLALLQPGASEERRKYYARVVRTEHMHDYHYPDPLGPPNPSQPCAKLLKGTANMWYCGNGFPKDVVPKVEDQSVAQDALRPDLWRCHLRRNCPLMNSHMPPVSFGLQSNSDAQAVVTRHQSEMYCCKYISKHSKGAGARTALFDVLDDMTKQDEMAKEKFGEAGFEAKKFGGKLHKAFMAEIGEEMCQAEVAHHANGIPEYFFSRRVKNVHFYRKALALMTNKRKEVDENDEDDEHYGEADWWSWWPQD